MVFVLLRRRTRRRRARFLVEKLTAKVDREGRKRFVSGTNREETSEASHEMMHLAGAHRRLTSAASCASTFPSLFTSSASVPCRAVRYTIAEVS